MMKKLLFPILLLCSVLALTLCVSATEYVSSANDLSAAFTTLGRTGGTIELKNSFAISSSLSLPSNTAKITVDGCGYTITLGANMAVNGEVDFKNIRFVNYGVTSLQYRSIPCNGNKVHFYDTVTCGTSGGAGLYPSIMAGYTASTAYRGGDLTIDGGTWQRVRAGNAGKIAALQSGSVTVNGGTFIERFQVGGAAAMASGSKIDVTLNGGTYNEGVIFFTPGDSDVFCDATLTVNGGVYIGELRLVEAADQDVDCLFGSATVCLNGGDFSGCTAIRGYNGDGMTVSMKVSEALANTRYDAESVYDTLSSTMVHSSMADPWLFTHNGYYYLTATGSTKIGLIRSKTLSGLSSLNITSNIIYDSYLDDTLTDLGYVSLSGTWSPEIHYYSEEDFPSNSGWYMFLALRANTGDSSAVQMVVLKSSSASPNGPYVHPITGEPNRSQPLLDQDGQVWSDWGCGQSSVTIPSGAYKGVYALWVSEMNRGTYTFKQEVKIGKLVTPWQIASEAVSIITPDQYWETIGSGYQNGKFLPNVVEGATAIYGDHGEIYLIYSGSGYWSNYGLGQMTLRMENGDYRDPLDPDSWIKYANNPTFSANDAYGSHYSEVELQGAGHASFFEDISGNRFLCYHAYPYFYSSSGWQKGSARNAYIEPYYINYAEVSDTAPYGLVHMGSDDQKRPADTHTEQSFVIGYTGGFTLLDKTAENAHMTIEADLPAPTLEYGISPAPFGDSGVWLVTSRPEGAEEVAFFRSEDGKTYTRLKGGDTLPTAAILEDYDVIIGNTYYYYACGVQNGAFGTPCAPITVEVIAAPDPVTLDTPVVNGKNVTLTWTAPDHRDGDRYRIVRYLDEDWNGLQVFETEALTFTDEGLEVDEYYYHILTLRGAANSMSTDPVKATVAPLTPVLRTSADCQKIWLCIEAEEGEYDEFDIDSSVYGSNSIPLYRGDADKYDSYLGGFFYEHLGTMPQTKYTYTITVWKNGFANTATYEVYTPDHDLTELEPAIPATYDSEGKAAIVRCTVCGKISGGETVPYLALPTPTAYIGYGYHTNANGVLEEGISVRSSRCEEADGYRFYRSTDGVQFTLFATVTGRPFMPIDADVEEGATYFYFVRLYRGDRESAPSATVSMTYRKLPATPVLQVTLSDGYPLLTWSAADTMEGDQYTVFRSDDDFEFDSIGETSDRSYLDMTAEVGKTYYYLITVKRDGLEKDSESVGIYVPSATDVPPTGDVNGDGKTSLVDALRILRYLADPTVEIDRNEADFNRDGRINLADALLILHTILNGGVS